MYSKHGNLVGTLSGYKPLKTNQPLCLLSAVMKGDVVSKLSRSTLEAIFLIGLGFFSVQLTTVGLFAPQPVLLSAFFVCSINFCSRSLVTDSFE